VKLGGVNVVPEPRDVPWLTDPANPTMVMGTPLPVQYIARLRPPILLSLGADVSHPPPGSRRGPEGYPSFTSLVGSVDSSGAKYISRMGVQDSLHEVIYDMKNMCVVRICALHRSKVHDD
jgi:eukaryotic translation initiation factor 2C